MEIAIKPKRLFANKQLAVRKISLSLTAVYF
jgi:hypothetical protein